MIDPLSLFLCSIPFWVPAAIGLYLVVNRPNELSVMAGLLTLKPIVTTPIWFAIISTLPRPVYKLEPTHLWSILPGAGLTLLTAFAFRRLLSGPGAGRARALLVLDCARWLNSFLLSLPYVADGPLVCLFAIIGLILPTAFAVVAVTTSLTHAGE